MYVSITVFLCVCIIEEMKKEKKNKIERNSFCSLRVNKQNDTKKKNKEKTE